MNDVREGSIYDVRGPKIHGDVSLRDEDETPRAVTKSRITPDGSPTGRLGVLPPLHRSSVTMSAGFMRAC
jgi:hypothetical protein